MTIVQDHIDRFGQHLVAVFGDDAGPGFIYTIGNANRALPELLAIGNFPPHAIGPILNDLCDRMRESGAPLEGDIDIGGTYPIRARLAGAAARTDYTIQAGQYLGHDEYAVVQVLFPDPSGRYPGEEGCDPRYDVALL